MRTLLILILVVIAATGCARRAVRPPPTTQADIINMSKEGVSDEVIIRIIQNSRTVYRLTADDVVRLRNAGVSSAVINYMLDSYVRFSQYEQRRADYYDYDYGFRYRFGFWYGPHWHRW